MNLAEISQQWELSRKLYVVYSALVHNFALGETCRDLDNPINRADATVLDRIATWFDAVDAKVEVHQIRQLLQATQLSTEENLRLLLKRQLNHKSNSAATRDKVDYLLVQYFAHCAPHDSHHRMMSLEEVADILRPIFGYAHIPAMPYSDAIHKVLSSLDQCKSLNDLLLQGILQQARGVKDGAKEDFLEPAVLIAFTRLNYLMRLGFFRLMHADLHAIRHALHQVEFRSQKTIDCSIAGLSAEEPVAAVRQICHEWKKPFRAAYSAGNNFRQLVLIRAAVENALAQPFELPGARVAEPEQAPSKSMTAEVPVIEAALAASASAGATLAAVAVPVPAVEAPSQQRSPHRVTIGGSKNPALPQDVDSCLELIATQLLTAKQTVSVTHVYLNKAKLLLASWEVSAFIRGGDEVSDALQRAVAARALLAISLACSASGDEIDLSGVLTVCKREAANLNARIDVAKRSKDIDGAVNLAATGKRLQTTIAEAEKR